METPILERIDFINNTEITTNTAYEPFHTYSDLLTVDELQDALSIGRNAAYRLIHDGEIKSLRIGRTIKVPKRYLLDFVYGSCYNSNVTSNGLTVLKEATV